jgi:hypothetical protein
MHYTYRHALEHGFLRMWLLGWATNATTLVIMSRMANVAAERIHVSPGFGVGVIRIKSGDSDP